MAQHECGMIISSFDNVEQSRFVYGDQHDYFFPGELISPSAESNFLEENVNYIMRPETDDSDPSYYSTGLFMNDGGNHDEYYTPDHQMGIYYHSELSQDGSSNTTITTSTGSHYSNGESVFHVHHPPAAAVAAEADIYDDGSFCNNNNYMAMMQYSDDQAAILSLNSYYNLLVNDGVGDIKHFGSSTASTANLMATDDDSSHSAEGPHIMDNIHPKCSVEESSSCTKSKKRGRGFESEVSPKVRKNVKSKGKINSKIAAEQSDTNATETMVLKTADGNSDQDNIDINGGQEKPTIRKTEKAKRTTSRTGSSMEAQSLYAKKRRDKINERLRILQGLVPNGKKLDMSTMLEEAVHYVKFLQHQIKMLSSEDLWMYAPVVHTSTTSPSL